MKNKPKSRRRLEIENFDLQLDRDSWKRIAVKLFRLSAGQQAKIRELEKRIEELES
ncbi:hypothetical protein [Actinomycetia phage DSL-LC01]|nr:hypothetical protein [Actinomycetia phage DSL-LC01]